MIKIREIQRVELEEVAKLEQTIFPDAWSLGSLEETYEQERTLLLGAWMKETLAGYLILYYVLDEGEIARIAAAPAARRKGVGSSLLEELENRCGEIKVQRLLLDVRAGNETARSFYRGHGFQEDGKRKNFYTNPVEDGILMSKDLGNGH